MSFHVVVGAGPIGSTTARLLAEQGHQVRVITRSGSGPAHPAIERVSADASDPARLTELAANAAALYNCANPPYHQWPRMWPPLADALLTAARRTGAVLVTMSNLYGYGPTNTAMTEDTPLAATTVKGRIRATMWADALAAHQAGTIRATEARASDFIGPDVKSLFSMMIEGKVKAGKTVYAPVNWDVPHSMTYTVDVARTLTVLGTDERAWGRAWHVPTNPATTLRQLAVRLAELAGAPRPKLAVLSPFVVRVAGMFSPMVRESIEIRYQFERPFILDSSAARDTFGLEPTPMDDVLRSVL